jgi:hypothetical protein
MLPAPAFVFSASAFVFCLSCLPLLRLLLPLLLLVVVKWCASWWFAAVLIQLLLLLHDSILVHSKLAIRESLLVVSFHGLWFSFIHITPHNFKWIFCVSVLVDLLALPIVYNMIFLSFDKTLEFQNVKTVSS